MTVSVSRALGLLVLPFALALPAGMAWAQDDEQPLSIIPLEDSGEVPPEETENLAAAEGFELEIESLPAVDTDSVGTLGPGNGGFGRDMWQGSGGARVAHLLARLDATTGSRIATVLARRLLLSAADVPEGVRGDFLGERVARLVALGMHGDVAGLISRAGDRSLTPAVRRGRIDALLLGGDMKAACAAVREAIEAADDAALALVFCQRLAGEQAAADLSLAILRDSGDHVGARFAALDRSLAANEPATLDSLDGASPLLFAMLMATGAEVPAHALEYAPAALLRALAENEDVTIETRLHAAEAAVSAGSMDGESLGALYLAAKSDGESAPDNNELTPERTAGPSGRALLFRIASRQLLIMDRARTLVALLQRAAAENGRAGFLAAARTVAPQIAEIPPSAALDWFSGDAALALLAAGDPDAAARWWPLLSERSRSEPAGAVQAAVVWPLLRLALGEGLADDGNHMRAWWDASQRTAGENAVARAERYLALMAALDDPAADGLLDDVLTAEPGPDAATAPARLLLALKAAARDGRLGETVLLALLALGGDGTATSDPLRLGAVVEALRAVGLDREARLVALEAAFAGGV